jgi:uncharacterized protein YidB (DUF937 family)
MGISKFITRNPQRINRSMEFPEDVMMRAPTDQAPFNVLDYGQLAAPVFNFAKSVAIGPSEPYVSDTMKDQLIQKAMDTGLDKGTLGYEDFGLPVTTKGGRFSGGLFDLALNDPVSFANVGSVGRVSFEKDPTAPGGYRFGDTKYDFSVDKDTGSTDNAFLDFINRGGIKSAIGDFFFAPAYAPEVTDKERQSIELEDNLMNYDEFYDMPEEKKKEGILSKLNPLNALGFLTNIYTGGLSNALTTTGLGTLFSKIAEAGRNTPNYQFANPNKPRFNRIASDFYDPRTGLDRFDRAKTLFGQSRTLKEYLDKKKAQRIAKQQQEFLNNQNRGGDGPQNNPQGGLGRQDYSRASNQAFQDLADELGIK